MITKYGRIKLITDHSAYISPETVKDIFTHIERNIPFALITPDDTEAMIFFPAQLTARHTNKEVFTYDCMENFIDAIKFTLYEYRKFLSCKGNDTIGQSRLLDYPTIVDKNGK